MDQQAAFALVVTSLLMAAAVVARLWIQRQRGTLRRERELRNVLVVVGSLTAVGVLLFSRVGVLLGLPAGLAFAGVTLLWMSRRQPEHQTGLMPRSTLEVVALLTIVSGVGGVVIGLVGLATGA